MLKKLIRVGVVMSLLVASVGASAQNTGKAEYPRYSFGSNWSLGFGGALTWEMAQHANSGRTDRIAGDNAGTEGDLWRRSFNAGFDVFMQHKQNHMLDTRYRLTMATLGKGRLDNDNMYMARYTTVTAEVKVSFTDWIKGYDPDRRHSWYGFVGFGVAGVNCFIDNADFGETRYGNLATGHVLPVVDAGLGYSLRFADSWSLYAELELNMNDYHVAFWQDFLDWDLTHGTFHIGVMKHFGLTAADQAIAAQKSMLTQENFGALNTQVTDLEQQVASSRNNEKKLQNRIAELEDQLAQALAKQGTVNSASADSLQNVINQIKADQINYYAMPFSVQYGVDEWQVSEDEMDKVKAVARVMKDNSDIKIKVIGFADYTGSDAYNMKLSEKRAKEVKRLLTKKYGIDEDRVEVDFKGKSAPFGDVQYAINRRVSFYRVID